MVNEDISFSSLTTDTHNSRGSESLSHSTQHGNYCVNGKPNIYMHNIHVYRGSTAVEKMRER